MEQSKYRKQAKIKTTGVTKTTPGLGRGQNNLPMVKVPTYGYPRSYRDPRSMDLVDIEQEKDRNAETIKELQEKAESEISAKKEARRKKELDAEVEAELQKRKEAEGKE